MKYISLKLEEQNYQAEEAYKSLRTNLQFCGDNKKVIVLTSCTQNEGKSTVSIRLAQSLAESGKTVIVVDADLRKSVMMGNITGHTGDIKGLSHVLSGQAILDDAVCETSIRNLYMMISGPFPPNPSELLGGAVFAKMIEVLRKTFDYVLIDSPPIGSVIDSAVIARQCDGAIFVIASGEISYRFAQDSILQIERSGCPMLGVILNKVDMAASYGRYYGKYYGKYYGEYGKKGREKS